jgi:hypothetical protein
VACERADGRGDSLNRGFRAENVIHPWSPRS